MKAAIIRSIVGTMRHFRDFVYDAEQANPQLKARFAALEERDDPIWNRIFTEVGQLSDRQFEAFLTASEAQLNLDISLYVTRSDAYCLLIPKQRMLEGEEQLPKDQTFLPFYNQLLQVFRDTRIAHADTQRKGTFETGLVSKPGEFNDTFLRSQRVLEGENNLTSYVNRLLPVGKQFMPDGQVRLLN